MGNEYKDMRRTDHRIGAFGDYQMYGFRLEKESGENGWVITAWPGRDPVHTYWVENGEFSSATYDLNYPNRTRIKILGEATNIEQEAKTVILRAIKEWESAPMNNPS